MQDEPLPEEVRRDTYVVIAAYNEAAGLGDVLSALNGLYPNVVVVDDGSRDGTFEVAVEAGVHTLRHLVNRGQGAALQTGLEYSLRAGAKYLVTFDADGQHRVQDVARMIGPLVRDECDVTLGSRFLGEAINLPFTRRVTLRLGVVFTRFFSRVKLTDTHNGIRGFSRAAAAKVEITLDRMAHANEIIDQIRESNLRFQEVPVQIRYTDRSLSMCQSSWSAVRIAVQYIANRIAR